MNSDQLRRLAEDLTAASKAPDMSQAPTEYLRNDVFRTLARSLRTIADALPESREEDRGKVWRTGRRVGRTIYVMNGPNASYEDRLIGVMDTPGLAVEAVSAHNDRLRARERDEDPREVREAFEQGPHGVTRES